VAAAELRNCFWKIADSPRVFHPEASYRRRGDVRSGIRCPHTWLAWPGAWPCHHGVWGPCGPPPTPLRISESFRVK
jgi:hypothetical protein